MRTHLARVVLAASCLIACGDPTAPPNNLRIVVATTGLDEDVDGYTISVGDRPSRHAPVDAIFEFLFQPGVYEVRIDGLAPNCAVQGPAATTVNVPAGGVAEARFGVECRAVTGVIEVLAPTAGRDFPAEGYLVYVTDESASTWGISAAANAGTPVSGLGAGRYELRFVSPPNCSLAGEDTRAVSVAAGGLVRDTARVEFAVTCTATTGDVRLSVTTNAVGGAPDPDGYTVKVDGVVVEEWVYGGDYGDYFPVPVRLALNGTLLFQRLAPGDHTVELGDLAAGCAVTGGNPLTVSVSVGAVTDVSLSVVCGAAP